MLVYCLLNAAISTQLQLSRSFPGLFFRLALGFPHSSPILLYFLCPLVLLFKHTPPSCAKFPDTLFPIGVIEQGMLGKERI